MVFYTNSYMNKSKIHERYNTKKHKNIEIIHAGRERKRIEIKELERIVEI